MQSDPLDEEITTLLERAKNLAFRLGTPSHAGGYGDPFSADTVRQLISFVKTFSGVEMARYVASGRGRRRVGEPDDETDDPAFICLKCGARRYFWGQFSPARFEAQAKQFEVEHAKCMSSYMGGGI